MSAASELPDENGVDEHGPDPSAPLDGWQVQAFEDDIDDDWELVSPLGTRIETCREDYPYDFAVRGT